MIRKKYIQLTESDSKRKLIIRRDSIIWLRNIDETTNIGLGSGPAGLFATSVCESIDEILKLCNGKIIL